MPHHEVIATHDVAARLGKFLAIAAACGLTAKAQNPVSEPAAQIAEPPRDKSEYTIFNPTPTALMREMNADRPDKTDSPFTVDAGHFQIEMDYANYSSDLPSAPRSVKTEGYQVAPLNLKVGLLNNLDFQVVLLPWQSFRMADETSGTVENHSGFGDITPRVKVSLIGNDGGRVALALIPFVTIPTAQDNLGAGSFEGGLAVPMAFDVPNWDVGLQTAINVNHDDAAHGYHAEIANSISLGHAVIGALGYHVEFFSSVSTERDSEWVGTFDTWLTYQLNKNLILDAGVYIGVTKAADDWHPWIGMTTRF